MRLTIDQYSKHFKMSKEMIHSKLRLKKLNYIIENKITYIIVTNNYVSDNDTSKTNQNQKETIKEKRTIVKPKTTVGAVISLYQKENTQLKEKIMQLEIKIDKLIDDKEQMLREERNKIEQLYNKKDEQLKNILELVNAKMILEQQNHTIHEIETHEVKALQTKEKNKKPIELKEYLKTLNIKDYQKKIIKKRFLYAYDSDIRVLQKNGKLYLNFEKYDYSDLLAY